jgi:hypothetical protein
LLDNPRTGVLQYPHDRKGISISPLLFVAYIYVFGSWCFSSRVVSYLICRNNRAWLLTPHSRLFLKNILKFRRFKNFGVDDYLYLSRFPLPHPEIYYIRRCSYYRTHGHRPPDSGRPPGRVFR